MAGRAEHQTDASDSFWTWRESMYRFAGVIDPDALRAIAAQLYVEMLEAGYTWVCEFHYLHHQPDGRPYADAAAMSEALIEAAAETGIGLCLLPVLYQQGGFDGRALSSRQARFGHDTGQYLDLLAQLRRREHPLLRVGMALHSLRAVGAEAMAEALVAELPARRPVHIHIAEQQAEVDECLERRGARPVSWLYDHAEVDARWTLVHATHLSAAEVDRIARSGATVALCPTTEANLGDGLFPLPTYLAAGGRFSIGSDSHISVSPVEELRWLEYGQRLRAERRVLAVDAAEPSAGRYLFQAALNGGRQSAGLSEVSELGVIVLDQEHPQFAATDPAQVLDTWIFAGNAPLVREVHLGGRCLVRDGKHTQRDAIAARYRTEMHRILA